MIKKVLLIEDETDLVDALRLRLESVGWKVSVALDGQEGLRKAREERPDLILLDVVIPKVDGYQVCRRLKASAETHSIPVILQTVRAQESDKKLGSKVGRMGISPSHTASTSCSRPSGLFID